MLFSHPCLSVLCFDTEIDTSLMERGIDLFWMIVEQELEGVMAKRKDSRYHM